MRKIKIKFVGIILVTSILFSFLQVFFVNNVNASVNLSSSYTQYVKSGISSFPESYQKSLAYLKYLHPNWNFEAYYTGISWSEVTSSKAENAELKNTIYKQSSGNGSLLDANAFCICGRRGDPGYYCASAKTVNYYLDPRNSLSEITVFQFLDSSNNSDISRDDVVNATKNNGQDTYLTKYTDYIIEASNESKISPLYIIATIFQELGKNGTPRAVSGNVSGYEGYYNFYNYGATDGNGAIERGLNKAKEMGWNNPRTAIIEGAKIVLGNDYINKGQNTKYFYKFDVVGNEILKESDGAKTYNISNFFKHQYMTNVQDPSSQASSLYNMYVDNGIIDSNLKFIIPVYDNMPEQNAQFPTSYNSGDGELYFIDCLENWGVNFRSTPGGNKIGNLYRGTIVLFEGTEGSWSKVKVRKVSSYDSNSKHWNNDEIEGYVSSEYVSKVGKEIEDYRGRVDMGNNSQNSSNVDFKIENSEIYMTSNAKVIDVKSKYQNAVIKKADGSDAGDNDLIGTGFIITIDNVNYNAVKKGDINGDGRLKASDYVLIKNHIMNADQFSDLQNKAADVNKDGSIKASDYVLIKNYIMYGNEISL